MSCNTVFAQLGLDLGGPILAGGANAFGFNQRPPLDLPAPTTSFFPDGGVLDKDKPALAKSAIGQQDVSASPLQMALVAAAIANNGTAMTPHVFAEARDSEGKVVSQEDLLSGTYGRIREMEQGPDGYIYFSTSNRDGRGSPAKDDDRIMRLVPENATPAR